MAKPPVSVRVRRSLREGPRRRRQEQLLRSIVGRGRNHVHAGDARSVLHRQHACGIGQPGGKSKCAVVVEGVHQLKCRCGHTPCRNRRESRSVPVRQGSSSTIPTRALGVQANASRGAKFVLAPRIEAGPVVGRTAEVELHQRIEVRRHAAVHSLAARGSEVPQVRRRADLQSVGLPWRRSQRVPQSEGEGQIGFPAELVLGIEVEPVGGKVARCTGAPCGSTLPFLV